jgi:hypothetical protein
MPQNKVDEDYVSPTMQLCVQQHAHHAAMLRPTLGACCCSCVQCCDAAACAQVKALQLPILASSSKQAMAGAQA